MRTVDFQYWFKSDCLQIPDPQARNQALHFSHVLMHAIVLILLPTEFTLRTERVAAFAVKLEMSPVDHTAAS